MKINFTNNINFNGTYRVNINHSMPNKKNIKIYLGKVYQIIDMPKKIINS